MINNVLDTEGFCILYDITLLYREDIKFDKSYVSKIHNFVSTLLSRFLLITFLSIIIFFNGTL